MNSLIGPESRNKRMNYYYVYMIKEVKRTKSEERDKKEMRISIYRRLIDLCDVFSSKENDNFFFTHQAMMMPLH